MKTGKEQSAYRKPGDGSGPSQVMVYTEYAEFEAAADALAEKLAVPFCSDTEQAQSFARSDLLLHLTKEGLCLEGAGLRLLPDFSSMRPRILKGNLQKEFLAKVSRIKSPDGEKQLYAIDATAGLGEDSFLLAACGYQVCMYERDPVISALLEDCLHRAAKDPQLAPIASRMQIVQGDSIQALRVLAKRREAQDESTMSLGEPEKEVMLHADDSEKEVLPQVDDPEKEQFLAVPDLIYLDPMFPQRRKSGLIGKKLQLLQKLEQPCMEEANLLQAAMEVHPRRIVIKRPLKGPYLDGKKPHYSLEGKAIRYDCFTFA